MDMAQKMDDQIEGSIRQQEADGRIIEAALSWRSGWVDQEDIAEMETGCGCEVCCLIRACDYI